MSPAGSATVAVTGATGTIGGALVPLLSRTEHISVRALTRSPSGRPDLPGVEWTAADLSEPAGLPERLEGADRLFLLTGNAETMVRLQKNAIRAAVEAGVRHVVKLSALGATDHSRSVIGLWHYNVERVLKASGTAWTILRPHHFMQNLFDPVVFDREAGRVHSASGDGRIPFVDTRDVAAVAAEVLTGEGHESRTYTLTGPEPRSYREATGVLSDALDRELDYVSESMDEAWRRRRAAGQPVWLVAAQLAIAGYQRAGGPTETTTDTVARLTGREPRSLREFVEDHVEELAAGR